MQKDISIDMISEYLSQVRASGVMGKSDRRIRLLEHLLTTEAQGDGETLKAYSIGLDVFEKPEDFDPAEDSSVRVEMGRLRTALAAFEASGFADTDLVVDIPVGTYRPELSLRSVPDKSAPATKRPMRLFVVAAALALVLAGAGWLLADRFGLLGQPDHNLQVAIEPFEGDDSVAAQVGSALRRALSRNQYVSVLSSTEPDADADFVIRGRINSSDASRYRINAEIINQASDSVIWAKTLLVDSQADIEQTIESRLGGELRGRLFGAMRELLSGRDPAKMTPEELFLSASWVSGPYLQGLERELGAVGLMQIALKKDPDFAAAHSVLADKLAFLANVYPAYNTPELLAQANDHAQRALALAPLDPDVVFNVAQAYWHMGRTAEAVRLMRRVVELDPGHDHARFLSIAMPYGCLIPPADVVSQLIAFDDALAPDNPIRWLTQSWISALLSNRSEYERALEFERRAAIIHTTPLSNMRRAMLLTLRNQKGMASQIINEQQALWPGLTAGYFVAITLPRLCADSPDGFRLIPDYEALVSTVETRQ